MGLIADAAEEAIEQLACNNFVSSKRHLDGAYNTLDYNRRVALLIPAVSGQSERVKELEAR